MVISESFVCQQAGACVFDWEYVLSQFVVGLFVFVALAVIAHVSQQSLNNVKTATLSRVLRLANNPVWVVFLILGSCLQFVAFFFRSYSQAVIVEVYLVELVFILFVVIDMCANLLSHAIESRVNSFIMSTLLVECFNMTSVVMLSSFTVGGMKGWFSFSFLGVIRVPFCFGRQLHRLRLSRIAAELILLFLRLAVVIFVSACLMFTVENLEDPLGSDNRDPSEWTLFRSIYFSVVTLSTVGYGDFSPSTVVGRLFACGVIGLGVAVFSLATSTLLDVLRLTRQGRGNYRPKPGVKFLVVTGNPSAQMICEFVAELFHPERLQALDSPLECVVLFPRAAEANLEAVGDWLKDPSNVRLRRRVTVLQGSALDPPDLARVSIERAEAVFVLPDLLAADTSREDKENAVRVLSVKAKAKKLRVLCLLHKGQHKYTLHAAGLDRGDVLCIDEFNQTLLAKSCLVPGFCTLVSNLFRAVGDEDLRRALEGRSDSSWVREYTDGLVREVYEVPLSTGYCGCTFMEVLLDVLARSGNDDVLLIGFLRKPKRYSLASRHSPTKGTPVAAEERNEAEGPSTLAEPPARVVDGLSGAVVAGDGEAVGAELKEKIRIQMEATEGEGISSNARKKRMSLFRFNMTRGSADLDPADLGPLPQPGSGTMPGSLSTGPVVSSSRGGSGSASAAFEGQRHSEALTHQSLSQTDQPNGGIGRASSVRAAGDPRGGPSSSSSVPPGSSKEPEILLNPGPCFELPEYFATNEWYALVIATSLDTVKQRPDRATLFTQKRSINRSRLSLPFTGPLTVPSPLNPSSRFMPWVSNENAPISPSAPASVVEKGKGQQRSSGASVSLGDCESVSVRLRKWQVAQYSAALAAAASAVQSSPVPQSDVMEKEKGEVIEDEGIGRNRGHAVMSSVLITQSHEDLPVPQQDPQEAEDEEGEEGQEKRDQRKSKLKVVDFQHIGRSEGRSVSFDPSSSRRTPTAIQGNAMTKGGPLFPEERLTPAGRRVPSPIQGRAKESLGQFSSLSVNLKGAVRGSSSSSVSQGRTDTLTAIAQGVRLRGGGDVRKGAGNEFPWGPWVQSGEGSPGGAGGLDAKGMGRLAREAEEEEDRALIGELNLAVERAERPAAPPPALLTYFIKGSGHSLWDLERAGFRSLISELSADCNFRFLNLPVETFPGLEGLEDPFPKWMERRQAKLSGERDGGAVDVLKRMPNASVCFRNSIDTLERPQQQTGDGNDLLMGQENVEGPVEVLERVRERARRGFGGWLFCCCGRRRRAKRRKRPLRECLCLEGDSSDDGGERGTPKGRTGKQGERTRGGNGSGGVSDEGSFLLSARYCSGQLVVSNMFLTLMTNMVFNRSMSFILQAFVSADTVAVPVPSRLFGREYAELILEFFNPLFCPEEKQQAADGGEKNRECPQLLPIGLFRTVFVSENSKEEDARGGDPEGEDPRGAFWGQENGTDRTRRAEEANVEEEEDDEEEEEEERADIPSRSFQFFSFVSPETSLPPVLESHLYPSESSESDSSSPSDNHSTLDREEKAASTELQEGVEGNDDQTMSPPKSATQIISLVLNHSGDHSLPANKKQNSQKDKEEDPSPVSRIQELPVPRRESRRGSSHPNKPRNASVLFNKQRQQEGKERISTSFKTEEAKERAKQDPFSLPNPSFSFTSEREGLEIPRVPLPRLSWLYAAPPAKTILRPLDIALCIRPSTHGPIRK
uniref:Potassium channel domain-containing protein n=1 Tax=Chromera velia CCMP2878 TaxID=1169474 RepID=A0A0G4FZ49_9ALVE|eukprot:Cvel_19462.t1-p1 / transcript=Cvel_19462.t1 / gene=Cvel_19462 / organism=Chromera_velia_CCMP2878 / gene_product=Calcium-activated potassium channel subunit alpha-1, putative / transcript_product=Calcium-activated potassium channel subunit alpha-1, putative / location=Cvel_scaffold1679:16831-27225(+) / protein_length=1707 / sequence_SO=supercontig / SO=protein_coding / is_pseudo=false